MNVPGRVLECGLCCIVRRGVSIPGVFHHLPRRRIRHVKRLVISVAIPCILHGDLILVVPLSHGPLLAVLSVVVLVMVVMMMLIASISSTTTMSPTSIIIVVIVIVIVMSIVVAMLAMVMVIMMLLVLVLVMLRMITVNSV